MKQEFSKFGFILLSLLTSTIASQADPGNYTITGAHGCKLMITVTPNTGDLLYIDASNGDNPAIRSLMLGQMM